MMGELLKASVLLGSISKSNSSLEECEICFHNPPDVLLSCYVMLVNASMLSAQDVWQKSNKSKTVSVRTADQKW